MTIPEEEVEAALWGFGAPTQGIAKYIVSKARMKNALLAAAKVRGARERNEMLEACAKLADAKSASEKASADRAYANGRMSVCDCKQAGAETADSIAKAIRALKARATERKDG